MRHTKGETKEEYCVLATLAALPMWSYYANVHDLQFNDVWKEVVDRSEASDFITEDELENLCDPYNVTEATMLRFYRAAAEEYDEYYR